MGRIILHIHGKLKNRNLRALFEEYTGRLGNRISVVTHSEKHNPAEYVENLPKSTMLLDEKGQQISSLDFAQKVQKWGLDQNDMHLAIGPHEGFGEVSQFSKISLSKMTMTHEFATVFLSEQIYRAFEIIKGTSYHRE